MKKYLMLLAGLIIGNLLAPFIRQILSNRLPPDIEKWGYFGAFKVGLVISMIQVFLFILILFVLGRLFNLYFTPNASNYFVVGFIYTFLNALYQVIISPIGNFFMRIKGVDNLIKTSSFFVFILSTAQLLLLPFAIFLIVIALVRMPLFSQSQ